jgi:hypothetical protein
MLIARILRKLHVKFSLSQIDHAFECAQIDICVGKPSPGLNRAHKLRTKSHEFNTNRMWIAPFSAFHASDRWRVPMRDPYDVLGVSRSATEADIKRVFRSLAKQLHPDANTSDPAVAARFAELNAAYEILGDENKRKAFDRGKIDAEGKPKKRAPVHPAVLVLAMTLALAAVTSLAIHSWIPQLNVPATTESGTEVASCPEASEKSAAAPIAGQTAHVAQPQPRVVLQQSDLYSSGDMIPLGLQISGEKTGAALEIRGLPTGTTLSVGRPLGTGRWRLLASDVGSATVHPPSGFSGTLDFVVELRLANDAIADSGEFRLQSPQASAEQVANQSAAEPGNSAVTIPTPARDTHRRVAVSQSDRDQIELLLARSQQLISEGDVATARLLLRRAAESSDARAALALGATYDPIMLAIVRAQGVAGDLSLARDWYKKASEFGSKEAQERLKLLASASLGGAQADH